MNPKTYSTGRPCKYGHGTLRYLSDRGCVQCTSDRKKKRKATNPEKVKAETQAYSRRKRLDPEFRARVKAYQVANRDKAAAATQRWRERHPERVNEWQRQNRPRVRVLQKEWRHANPEKSRAYSREWDARNADSQAAKRKEWRAANPDILTALWAKRRATEMNAPGAGVTAKQYRGLMADALGLCAYCNERRPLTLDHIEPLTRGGAHDIENAAAICQPCNSSKHNSPLLLWLARKG